MASLPNTPLSMRHSPLAAVKPHTEQPLVAWQAAQHSPAAPGVTVVVARERRPGCAHMPVLMWHADAMLAVTCPSCTVFVLLVVNNDAPLPNSRQAPLLLSKA